MVLEEHLGKLELMTCRAHIGNVQYSLTRFSSRTFFWQRLEKTDRLPFFDDFVTFSDSNEQVSVDASVRFLLNSLGWRFAGSGDKAPPFSGLVNAPGVSIDVSSMGEGKILIDNTANRKLEISSVISSVIEGGRLPRADALRLRGKASICIWPAFPKVG